MEEWCERAWADDSRVGCTNHDTFRIRRASSVRGTSRCSPSRRGTWSRSSGCRSRSACLRAACSSRRARSGPPHSAARARASCSGTSSGPCVVFFFTGRSRRELTGVTGARVRDAPLPFPHRRPPPGQQGRAHAPLPPPRHPPLHSRTPTLTLDALLPLPPANRVGSFHRWTACAS